MTAYSEVIHRRLHVKWRASRKRLLHLPWYMVKLKL